MNFILETQDTSQYLKSSDVLDFDKDEPIKNLTESLKLKAGNEIEFIRVTYEYVRDQISHSADINGKRVTCRASEVLKEKEGICYAKSHLLAALLRCMGIPAGFCYQKLILDDAAAPYLIIHGLNAVYLKDINKWIRLDARGNKSGVNAQFSLSGEMLAFEVRKELGEEDIPVIFSKPDKNVVRTLLKYSSVEELFDHLPKELA